MTSSLSVTSDVASAGTALGGLLLVFLGNATSGFGGYDKQGQNTVRARYQIKAWAAVLGIILALTSAALSLLSKRFESECGATASIGVLLVALTWVAGTAIAAAREIK